eukprot:scaffold950_cov360-Pavlova_lutheri.AAC.40
MGRMWDRVFGRKRDIVMDAHARGAMDPQMEHLVLELSDPTTRENALLDLSKKRESFPELAPCLWHSFGTVSALLQEIIAIYPMLSPPTLTAHASNRVCNALALLQCVASHPDTRQLFLQGAWDGCVSQQGVEPTRGAGEEMDRKRERGWPKRKEVGRRLTKRDDGRTPLGRNRETDLQRTSRCIFIPSSTP